MHKIIIVIIGGAVVIAAALAYDAVTTPEPSDVNADGEVNLQDLSIVMSQISATSTSVESE
jgi:hypothetical protein